MLPLCYWIMVSIATLPEKCPYSELFWSAFSRIWTEYGEIRSVFPYSGRMRENANQSNSEYGHFLCSAIYCFRVSLIYILHLKAEVFLMSFPNYFSGVQMDHPEFGSTLASIQNTAQVALQKLNSSYALNSYIKTMKRISRRQYG